ncbi:acetyl-CoA carboxylase biotin carboxyl carrier protein [Nocardia inohanensis]|uniref:acetyl-CoA carboxylase biotin carboxyl carrier protein n=1 Tax=Nocardia inohanensis TaxID=209246 RepID=UPI000A420295|nr:biotin/lipoyl-containing protein [Nocardia inohanensis]
MSTPLLDTVDTVTALADSVLAAAARADRPPLSIRVAAGVFQVEVTWAQPATDAADAVLEPLAGNGQSPAGLTGHRDSVTASGHGGPVTAVGQSGPGAVAGHGGRVAATGARGVASAAAPDESGSGTDDSGTFPLCAPMVGVFYHAPEPGADPFVAVGDTVTRGQQVGITEAMKLMVPVEADRAGIVAEILVSDATAVEFGQPLLLLREAER